MAIDAPDPDDPAHGGELAALDAGERRDLLGLGALAAAWAIVPALCGFWLLARIGWVSDRYVDIEATHGEWTAIAVYAVIFGVTAGLGLLPTYAQAFLGGWIFGSLHGTAGAMAGILIGATLGWGVAILVSGKRVEAIIERRPSVRAVRDALVDAGFMRTAGLVALLRLSPNSPFALSNLALGGSRTGPIAMLLGTAVGMLPRTALAVILAAAARVEGTRGLGDVVRERGPVVTIAGIVVLVVAFVVIARVGRAALQRALPSRSDDSN